MTEAIIVALITGGFTFIGVLISNSKKDGAIEERLNELTREVREHNGFARRMPVVEEQITSIKRRLDDIEHHDH